MGKMKAKGTLPGIVYSDPVETRVLRMRSSLWDFLEARKWITGQTVQNQLRALVEAELHRVNQSIRKGG